MWNKRLPHLQFCMVATTLVWLYAERLDNAPKRRYANRKRTEYTFADARRNIADEIARPGFVMGCHKSHKPAENTLPQTFMRLVA